MKKLSCAAAAMVLASMGASATAAGDSVRLYGSFEVGPEYVSVTYKGKKHARVGMGAGGERFGLTGSHAINSDLSTRFTLEAAFSTANGGLATSRLFARETSFGLVHRKFGSVDFGRHYNFAALYQGEVDPFGGGYGLSGSDTVLGSGVRADNLMLYQTPNFSGFEGGIGYSFGMSDIARAAENKAIAAKTGKSDFFSPHKQNRLLTAGVKYAEGPLTMVATYDRLMRRPDALEADTQGRDVQAYMLGVAYAMEPFTLYGALGQTFGGWLSGKNMSYMPDQGLGFRDNPFAKGFSATSALIGAQFNTGPHRFMASWQQAKPKNALFTGGSKTFNMYAVGYRYAMSKRTDLAAFMAYGTNYAFVDGLKGMQTSVRLRHRF